MYIIIDGLMGFSYKKAKGRSAWTKMTAHSKGVAVRRGFTAQSDLHFHCLIVVKWTLGYGLRHTQALHFLSFHKLAYLSKKNTYSCCKGLSTYFVRRMP